MRLKFSLATLSNFGASNNTAIEKFSNSYRINQARVVFYDAYSVTAKVRSL